MRLEVAAIDSALQLMKGYDMETQSIMEIYDLKGKAAIVTGGAMGIGEAIALRLAEAGASVMIADISQEAANKVVERIKSKNGNASAIYADASSVDDASKVVQATVDAFGRLDILVNNAGIYPFTPALQMTELMWDKVLGINLKGVFFFAQAAAQQMIQAGHGGKIVNIASIDSLHPTGNLAHYDASKGGVVMVTKALALGVRSAQDQCQCHCPRCHPDPWWTGSVSRYVEGYQHAF